MATLALSPVSVAVYGVLSVDATMITLVGTRIYDDVPQGVTYPCVFYSVREKDVRGFGTGGLPEVSLLVSVFSTYQGMSEAQAIMARVIALLKDASLTATGYTQAGKAFYDETLAFADVEVNGVKVRELVSRFRIYMEQQ